MVAWVNRAFSSSVRSSRYRSRASNHGSIAIPLLSSIVQVLCPRELKRIVQVLVSKNQQNAKARPSVTGDIAKMRRTDGHSPSKTERNSSHHLHRSAWCGVSMNLVSGPEAEKTASSSKAQCTGAPSRLPEAPRFMIRMTTEHRLTNLLQCEKA